MRKLRLTVQQGKKCGTDPFDDVDSVDYVIMWSLNILSSLLYGYIFFAYHLYSCVVFAIITLIQLPSGGFYNSAM